MTKDERQVVDELITMLEKAANGIEVVDDVITTLEKAANGITTLTDTCGLLREALPEAAAAQFDETMVLVAQARALADDYRAVAHMVRRTMAERL